MYQILYYSGFVLMIGGFITAAFLLFKNRIPSVIRYFIRMSGKKMPKRPASEYKAAAVKMAAPPSESTELLDADGEPTVLLDAAHQYATALLDADSTTLLPELVEEIINKR